MSSTQSMDVWPPTTLTPSDPTGHFVVPTCNICWATILIPKAETSTRRYKKISTRHNIMFAAWINLPLPSLPFPSFSFSFLPF